MMLAKITPNSSARNPPGGLVQGLTPSSGNVSSRTRLPPWAEYEPGGSANVSEDSDGDGSIGLRLTGHPTIAKLTATFFNGNPLITGNWAIVGGNLSSSLSLSESGNLRLGARGLRDAVDGQL